MTMNCSCGFAATIGGSEARAFHNENIGLNLKGREAAHGCGDHLFVVSETFGVIRRRACFGNRGE
jgi:hypothetical protein